MLFKLNHSITKKKKKNSLREFKISDRKLSLAFSLRKCDYELLNAEVTRCELFR